MNTLQVLQVGEVVAEVVSRVAGDVVRMIGLFFDVAIHDPLSALMFLVGAALIGLSSAVFGGLSVGSAFGWLFRLVR